MKDLREQTRKHILCALDRQVYINITRDDIKETLISNTCEVEIYQDGSIYISNNRTLFVSAYIKLTPKALDRICYELNKES